jgi:hypothetical protein
MKLYMQAAKKTSQNTRFCIFYQSFSEIIQYIAKEREAPAFAASRSLKQQGQ